MNTPDRKESFRTRLARWRFNLFPAYVGSGARVTYIAADWREVRIELPLSWRTRNYVVWDKAASIRFRRPGPATLHARVETTVHVSLWAGA